MVIRREIQAWKSRPDDGTENPLDFYGDDYDGSLDEFMAENLARDDDRAEYDDYLPSWRHIDSALEDTYMKMIFADFDDDGEYDEFEYFGDDVSAEYSH